MSKPFYNAKQFKSEIIDLFFMRMNLYIKKHRFFITNNEYTLTVNKNTLFVYKNNVKNSTHIDNFF